MVVRTLCAGNGDENCVDSKDTGAGAVAESGDACDVRCSSAPSSVAVMGVGMSRLGASMSVLAGFECASAGICVWTDASCGGGVGCCMGIWGADSTLLAGDIVRALFNSWAAVMRDSSGGQVARAVTLSCSTGETVVVSSSGVGIIRQS